MNDLVVSCSTTLILTACLIAFIPFTSLSENMLTVQVYIFFQVILWYIHSSLNDGDMF